MYPATCFLPCCVRSGDGDHLIAHKILSIIYCPWEYLDRIPSRSNRDGPQIVSRYGLRHVHILGLGQIMLRRMRVKMSEFERRRQYSFLAGADSLTLLGIRSSVLVISSELAPTNGTVSKPAVNVGRVTEIITECAGF